MKWQLGGIAMVFVVFVGILVGVGSMILWLASFKLALTYLVTGKPW